MKPEPVVLRRAASVEELVACVLRTRLTEVRKLAAQLNGRTKRGLHDFRIACKRLRYALERFAAVEPSLDAIGEGLACLQDALGEAHDRDVLLGILPPTMPATERRLRTRREACVNQAIMIWKDVEQRMRALDSHLI